MPPEVRWSASARRPVELPETVERALAAFLKSRFPKATKERLKYAVRDLSEAFTAERARLPGSYLNQPPVRSAYLAFAHPQQMLRGLAALDESVTRAGSRGLWPERVERVLDLGAGLGAMTQAYLVHRASEPWPSFTMVDHQRSALKDARALTTSVALALHPDRSPPHVRTAPDRLLPWLASEREGSYDVVLLGAVLNERREAWEPLLAALVRLVRPGGIVIVVEPAHPATGRRLMELRESALGMTTTVAPCTHAVACPLLALRKDWCFSTRGARLPESVAALARVLGHQAVEVRYALWTFAPRPDAAPFEAEPGTLGRIVSDEMDRERVICVDGERQRSRGLGVAQRGDLARSRGGVSDRPSSGRR